MAYFLGRDVEVFLTTESDGDASTWMMLGTTAEGVTAMTVTGAAKTNAQAAAANGIVMAACLSSAAAVSGGRVADVTGIDLSISSTDEEEGPYFGQRTTHKIEIRKEQSVTLTRKKNDQSWDFMYNGPCGAAHYSGSAVDAAAMGPRWGCVSGAVSGAYLIGDGNYNPRFESTTGGQPVSGGDGATGVSLFGYRLHVRLKNSIDGEVYTVRNAMITGHTVSLNADGTMEETMEFMSNVPPIFVSGANTFNLTLTCPATGM